jgi:hypothetical protein
MADIEPIKRYYREHHIRYILCDSDGTEVREIEDDERLGTLWRKPRPGDSDNVLDERP